MEGPESAGGKQAQTIPKSKGIIKEFEVKKKFIDHICSNDHRAKGIMKLGRDELDIANKIANKVRIADSMGLLQEKANQFVTNINGFEVTIRVFIQNGKITSLNGFMKTTTRQLGNVFKL